MTNPYLTQLVRSLPPSVEPTYFSWRRALVGRFDVFHVHWPEVLLRGRTRWRGAIHCVLFLLVLIRIRLQRKALVRTIHNVQPHEPLGWLEAAIARVADRWTTLWISLTDRVASPTDAPTIVVPHGHYRDWYAHLPATAPIRGCIVHIGRIRAYKGVDSLLDAFMTLRDDGLTLHVVGKIDDVAVGERLRDAARHDQRITVTEGYATDEVLAGVIHQSELVVLPYREITNSGSALLALSLDRPVLAPATEVMVGLAAEVGEGWVLTYDGPLDADTLARALARSREGRWSARPDLSWRAWPPIGEAHASAFARAVELAASR